MAQLSLAGSPEITSFLCLLSFLFTTIVGNERCGSPSVAAHGSASPASEVLHEVLQLAGGLRLLLQSQQVGGKTGDVG